MPTLYLVRHGRSVFNLQNLAEDDQILGGQTDTPLAPEGQHGADALGASFARKGITFDHAVSSALSRAKETLHRVLAHQPHSVHVRQPLRELNERSLGVFEGMKLSEVHASFPDYAKDPLKRFRASYHVCAPDGEHYGDVEDRMAAGIEPIVHQADGNIVIVSHKHSIRAWVRRALNLSHDTVVKLPIPNTEPIVIEYDGDYRLIEGLDIDA